LKLSIQKLHPAAKIPTRATVGSAGLDLYALLDAPLILEPGGRATVGTGIAIGLPSRDMVGLVFARSGLAIRHGITKSNGVGVIDSDYTGELRVGLVNLGDAAYTIRPGERVAQLVVMPVWMVEPVEVEVLEATDRADGGFGSTGR